MNRFEYEIEKLNYDERIALQETVIDSETAKLNRLKHEKSRFLLEFAKAAEQARKAREEKAQESGDGA